MKTIIFHRIVIVTLVMGLSVISEEARGTSATEASKSRDIAAETTEAGQEETEEQQPTLEQRVENINKRLDQVKQLVDSIKVSSSPILQSRYKRNEEQVRKRVDAALKQQQEIDAARSEQEKETGNAFEYEEITRNDTDEYIKTGNELVKKASSALSSKNEMEQIRGMELFGQVSEMYRGAAKYQNLKKKYKTAAERFLKKWNRSRDLLESARQKATETVAKKQEALDKKQYEKESSKLSSQGKDIKKSWFLPPTNNILILTDACNVAKTALAMIEKESSEVEGKTEEVLNSYWDELDAVRQLMIEGRYDEGLKKLHDSDISSQVRALGGNSITQDMRASLMKQVQELRNELQSRNNADRKLTKKMSRITLSLNRDLDAAENLVEGMEQDCARIKEDEERRSIEAAAREKAKARARAAATDARRKAVEDEDTDADEQGDDEGNDVASDRDEEEESDTDDEKKGDDDEEGDEESDEEE